MTDNIIKYLQNEINEKMISHAFLVETNNCDKLCEDVHDLFVKNNLIEEKNINNNINIKIIEPENNLIDRSKILDLQKFTITTSVLDTIKIYFIKNAELMNSSAYNKLLKVLEEPSNNVIGFLITKDDSQIIPTIKSRCKKFVQYYQEQEKIITNQNLCERIITAASLSYEEIIKLKQELLGYEKIDIINIIQNTKELINNKITTSADISLLANYYKILDNIKELIKSNVNIELSLDKLFIEMRK